MKRISIIGVLALGAACGGEPTQTEPAADAAYQETLMTRLLDAQPGDVIEIPAGTFAFDRSLSLTVDGVTIRGQGMDETVLSFKNQVAGAEGLLVTASDFTIEDLATGLWFSGWDQRSLDTMRWAAHYRAYWGLDMTLRCGPAGVDGEIVAYLDPPGGRGQLSSADIVPIDGQGACGMAVNNVASLLEALLRGHIYIAYSPRCDGGTVPCGYDVVTARAQFPPYNSDDQFIRDWLSW